MTSFEKEAGTPRWSPDSRRLVFDSIEAGDFDLYVIEADGGVPRRLTRHPSADTMGTWSRDGRWIFFRSDRSGTRQIWKISAEGGEAVQVTTGGGVYALESWDGRYLYYVKFVGSTRGIWRVPVNGGEEAQVLPAPGLGPRALSVFRSGIYYSQLAPGEFAKGEPLLSLRRSYTVHFFDFESGQVTKVFEDDCFDSLARLTVSPDEEWILYSNSTQPVSELMLVENFR